MIGRIRAWAGITRAHNCLAAGLAAAVGAWVNGAGPGDGSMLARAVLLVVVVVAAGNVTNDLRDIDVDRLEKPTRPLPSGAVTPRAARTVDVALVLAAVWLFAGLPSAMIVFAAICLVVGLSYSFLLKSTVLLGNVCVAALSSATLIFGAMVVRDPGAAVVAATVIVFLFVTAREVLKDVADHDGDAAMRITTVSTTLGRDASLRIVTLVMALFGVAAHAPLLLGVGGSLYLVVMWAAVILPTLGALVRLRGQPDPADVAWALRVTKVAWFNGLFAMALLR